MATKTAGEENSGIVSFNPAAIDRVARFVKTIGIGSAIAFYLIYWITTSFSVNMVKMADSMERLTRAAEDNGRQLEKIGDTLSRIEGKTTGVSAKPETVGATVGSY